MVATGIGVKGLQLAQAQRPAAVVPARLARLALARQVPVHQVLAVLVPVQAQVQLFYKYGY